ncbi:hypothetical protein STRAU_4134 [Streptomyces aurantiacus JA 4570]|uniref:Uncharacterized protein n=1 Tax=Streptomyces aurantiacus JA 4570 TaxID=1286094 RepID=S3ZI31_9ACTN|nr:hypothetical protein STRAU_4134 [Streptomyces aurantiacus JA 4570]
MDRLTQQGAPYTERLSTTPFAAVPWLFIAVPS